jgi:hypothetical protein
VNIKITEKKGGGWSLWATEGPGEDERPIYTATGRTREQVQALLAAILPESTPVRIRTEVGRDDAPVTNRKTGAHGALVAMLGVLDGWIQGSRENHVALGHRAEPVGEECWRQFAPSDIRRMVNDAAREMGLANIPEPEVRREDAAWP